MKRSELVRPETPLLHCLPRQVASVSQIQGQGSRFHLLVKMSWVQEGGGGGMAAFMQAAAPCVKTEQGGSHLSEKQVAVEVRAAARGDWPRGTVPLGPLRGPEQRQLARWKSNPEWNT